MIDKLDASLIPAPVTGPAVGLAHQFGGVTIFFIVLATLLCGARTWTRCHPVFKMTADDYVCVIAYLPVVIGCAFLLQTVPWVFNGKDPSRLTLRDAERGFKYAIVAQIFWTWAMCLTKISIALMLVRLEQNKAMRRFLWTLIALLVVVGIYCMLSQLLQCIPLHAAWDFLGGGPAKSCWNKATGMLSAIIVQIINIATDWILALCPISFLRKVKRPLRERVVVSCLMGLGVFAGIVSLVKLVYLLRLGKMQEDAYESIRLGMLSCLEELLAFVAACIPCLKAPFQRCLEYFGLATYQPRERTVVNTSRSSCSGIETSSRPWTVESEARGALGSGSTRLSHFGEVDSASEERILAYGGIVLGDAKMYPEQMQQDAEDVMIMQSHTPALPPPRPTKKF